MLFVHPWLSIVPTFLGLPILFYVQGFDPAWLIGTVAVLFLVDSLGVQIGVHKLMSHRSFEASVNVRRGLAFLSVLSGQGSPLFWVAVHMGSHHPHYDTEKDIHSPKLGRFYAFLSWYWNIDPAKVNFAPARRYLSDRFLLFLHRNHPAVLLGYWLSLLSLYPAFGFKPLMYLGLLPAVTSISLVGVVNTFMHRRGFLSHGLFMKYQNHRDESTYNSVLLGFFTMGLGLHNNHHQAPHEPYYDQRWYEIDLSRWIIPFISEKTKPVSKS